jgi:hypothetical protein
MAGMADQLEQIRPYAAPYLDDDEDVVAAMTAAPRGRNTMIAAGGIAGMIGGKMVSGQVKRAGAAGLRLDSKMAVVLTQRRLIALKVKFTVGGTIKGVEEDLGSVPLSEVDSIDAKRVGLGGNLILRLRGGEPVKLECQVGRARQLADAFNSRAATV